MARGADRRRDSLSSQPPTEGDPVAWRTIERGWSVFDADGKEIGQVDQITGDLNADIFNGLTVGDGGTVLTRASYISAEHVTAIRQGQVVLDLRAADVAKLERYVAPVSEPLASLAQQDEEPPARGMSLIDRLFGRRL